MANQKTNIQLSQKKVFVGPDAAPTIYVVQNKVTSAYPDILGFPFIVQFAGPPYFEVLVKVATLEDILSPFSPYQSAILNEFVSGEIDLGSIDLSQNPILRLYNYPAEWSLTPDGVGVDPASGLSGVNYKNYTILTAATGDEDQPTLTVDVPFISKYKPNVGGFSFEIYDDAHPSSPIASGVAGHISRTGEGNGLSSPFFSDTWMATFDTALGAYNHVASVQANIASLVKQAAKSGTDYLAAPPGNPITSTFTG